MDLATILVSMENAEAVKQLQQILEQQGVTPEMVQSLSGGGLFSSMSTSMLVITGFMGILGFAYARWGWVNQRYVPIFTGLIMSVYPFFFKEAWLVLLIGVVLALIPFYWKT